MSRIAILCPYNKQKEVFNLLNPLIKEKNYQMFTCDMMGQLLSNTLKLDSEVATALIAASSKEYSEFFGMDNIILLGFQYKETKADVIISYLTDMIEAEELFMNEKIKYTDNYCMASQANYKAEDPIRLLQLVNGIL